MGIEVSGAVVVRAAAEVAVTGAIAGADHSELAHEQPMSRRRICIIPVHRIRVRASHRDGITTSCGFSECQGETEQGPVRSIRCGRLRA